MAMRTFKEYVGPVESLQEHLINSTKQQTDFLVDAIYSNYIKEFDKSQPQCVGWLDGEENGLLRNQLIYEAGIENDDSVLDIGCGVAHFYHFLKMEGWDGKYLGIDPNKAAIDVVEESINTKCGTIEDLDDTKYDWVIASGVFNLGLQESHTFWIIHNMILRANKGIVFNMLSAPYEHPEYEAYDSGWVKKKLEHYKPKKLEIIEEYFRDNEEFTVYFYV